MLGSWLAAKVATATAGWLVRLRGNLKLKPETMIPVVAGLENVPTAERDHQRFYARLAKT